MSCLSKFVTCRIFVINLEINFEKWKLFLCQFFFSVNTFVLILVHHPNMVYLKEGPTNLNPYILNVIFQ